MFTGSCRATFFVCESASSEDIVAQVSHVPCERRGLDPDRSRGGSSKMSLVRTESQLPIDTADNTKQDFRVRVPEFEVATESRPEEVKPLAKARTVILEEKCGAEFSSCGLIHTSFVQLSRPAVSMRRQRLRRRSGTIQKACFFSEWHSRRFVLLLPPASRRTATSPSAVRRRRQNLPNSRSGVAYSTRKHHERDVASLQVSLGFVALTKHRVQAQ